ncbi:MAG TPA: putative motility protein [Lachnospiraceae bacterium]|nr:putative motility protein [Lachnospiraceae bacterium]
MDIPALSIALSQAKIGNEVGIKMLDMALGDQQDFGKGLVNMIDRSLELSVNPDVGSNFDVSV